MSHITELLKYIAHLAANLTEDLSAKFTLSVGVSVYGFLFGFEIRDIMLALFALVAFDLVTGVMASYKNGQPVKSRMILRSAVKLSVYGLLVSSAHLTEAAVPGTTFMDEGIIAFLAITEMISILENAGLMGFAIPQKLLNQLRDLRANDDKITP